MLVEYGARNIFDNRPNGRGSVRYRVWKRDGCEV